MDRLTGSTFDLILNECINFESSEFGDIFFKRMVGFNFKTDIGKCSMKTDARV